MEEMQFITLNSDFSINSIIYPTNIQWTRQYYEPGAFSIQLPIAQYDKNMKYVYTKDRPELGMITEDNYSIDSSGFQSVQISGNFIEAELNDKIVYPQYVVNSNNVEDAIKNMVTKYKKDIPLLEVSPSQKRGTPSNFQSLGDELGRQCFNILTLHQMSCKIVYDYERNKKVFDIWQGKDRTQSQTANNPVVFSTEFGNIKEPSIVQRSTDYKNYALVYGEIDQVPIYVVADASGGGYQKQIYIESSGVRYDANEMTEAEYMANLKQAGLQQLVEDYSSLISVEFDVLQGSYKYMEDFDLGDKCEIVIASVGLTLEARILTVYEVIKGGQHKITLEFGNQKIKTKGR